MPTLTLTPTQQVISRHIYGHFAEHLGRCIYDGFYVGTDSPIPNTRGFRNDVVDALNQIHIPNLRWPGGCFADTYNWKDGIGPKAQRPSMVNVHWGGTVENNHVGTHEFLDLCQMLGTEPYICGNVGSGTVREMAEWLEYLTMGEQSPWAKKRKENGREQPWENIKWWAVGNENWGCGGNMRAEYYADEYRRFASYCRHFSPGKKLYKIACGYDNAWNEILMERAGSHLDGVSIHYYTLPTGKWDHKGPSMGFGPQEWHDTLRRALGVDDFLNGATAVLDKHDPKGRVGLILDEWGTWYDVEPGTNPGFLYQQNTLRDAIMAAISFDVFHRHAKRLHMANIAQTVNVLQAMILTEGPRMLLTPTYHTFDFYKVHQDATFIDAKFDDAGTYTLGEHSIPHLSATASRDKAGKVHICLTNLHHEKDAEVAIDGAQGAGATTRILTAPSLDTHNTFESPNTLTPQVYDALKVVGGKMTVKLPAKSVVAIEVA